MQTMEWECAMNPKRYNMKKLIFEPESKENVQQQIQYKSYLVDGHTNRTDQQTRQTNIHKSSGTYKSLLCCGRKITDKTNISIHQFTS